MKLWKTIEYEGTVVEVEGILNSKIDSVPPNCSRTFGEWLKVRLTTVLLQDSMRVQI